MLSDAGLYSRIYLAYGYTDLRFGIDGLSRAVQNHFALDPFQKNILFLFCDRRTDRIKGLVWEGNGFLLVYKRLEFHPASFEVKEHHVAVYAGMDNETIVKAARPKSLLRGSIVTPSLEAAVINGKYVNSLPHGAGVQAQ